jgi:outer membrane immunogenic protein
MKSILGALAVSALFVTPVMAADLPTRMPVKAPAPAAAYGYNWSGFYVGAHAGGAWSDECFTFAPNGSSDGCHDGNGWLGGGQVGFNWQTGNVVFGAEFSGSFADVSGDHRALLLLTGAPTARFTTELSSILLLTGRVGLSFDRVLLYVTGGGAWGRDKFEHISANGVSSAKHNRTGWTVGAGVEWGLSPNWSIAAQYNFIDLGDKDANFTGPVIFTERVEQDVHLATVRLNYRFGPVGAPAAARY